MLVFNEGVPRAGKSYDAVKNHVLPTLRKGRRVFARLNGLDHVKIAEHLKMSLADVQALLVVVDTNDVRKLFACYQDGSGKWCIPDDFKDALIVVDEVHEFYVKQRLPLPDAEENFWALLGQNGGDAVIMTQWINRVHQALVARIERKNVFQKLTAVGLKNRYRVTYYHSTSPGKFEKVGGKTEKYDPAIYPLYHGYAPGSDNTEVYEEGGTTVWKAMVVKGALFGVAGLVGAYFFLSFFFSAGGTEDAPPQGEATQVFDTDGRFLRTELDAQSTAASLKEPPKDEFADLSPDQRFVAKLSDLGRARLAARAEVGGRIRGWVEWVNDSGETMEQIEVAAIEALGYTATWANYGVKLVAGDHVIIATPWPREIRVRESDHTLYNLSSRDGAAGLASGASEAGSADRAGVTIDYAPGQRPDVFPRSPGYQATQTYTGPVSSL
ncbi:zonular occludens toxin domain-containing protein [Pseudoxanthomonas sp. SE1]|uniref:zonular occludens toxin domain-containing protein n=1 Tax=Pseudoxanthomonas sp. SE1 TaxID=1664560 RepID=UPI00240DABCD|nr:zonular occludens toxin domain-containing protein [Pseudoxanthomonas sp. SE1]WFC43780.1 hypothetical protein OY559_09915 [Pseudoxanthomonas sp. SE1]